MAFLHGEPNQIPSGLTEQKPAMRRRLASFRQKVQKQHCKYWVPPEGLKAIILSSLIQQFQVNPRLGWIRADQQSSSSPSQLHPIEYSSYQFKNFAGIYNKTDNNDTVTIEQIGEDEYSMTSSRWKCTLFWNRIFKAYLGAFWYKNVESSSPEDEYGIGGRFQNSVGYYWCLHASKDVLKVYYQWTLSDVDNRGVFELHRIE